jgi:hypothetical protein
MFDGRGPVSTQIFIGAQPWWASPALSVAFWRPVATASHYLDYLLWPESPWLMHAHNVVLYVALVLTVTDLYRRLLGPGPSWVLASVLYAVDDAHVMGTAWIASRNTLLTAALAFIAMKLYLLWSCEHKRWAGWLSPLVLLLAHACSEGAIMIWPYLLAYAAFLDLRPVRRRIVSLLPMLIVTVISILVVSRLGYGVRGSGAYIDPRVDPRAFIEHAVVRFPDLLRVEFGLSDEVGSQLWHSALRPVQALFLALWLPLLFAVPGRFWRSSQMLYFLVAMAGALVPLCSIGSIARLLYIPGFGAHGFTAVLIASCLSAVSQGRIRQRVGLLAARTAICAQATIAVLGLVYGPRFWTAIHQEVLREMRTLPSGLVLANSILNVVNTSDFLAASFVAGYRAQFGMPGPRSMHILGVSTSPVRVTRLSATEFALEPNGGYLRDATSELSRSRREPFLVGSRVPVDGAEVEIAEVTADGRPARIVVRTAHDLDSPSYIWVQWDAAVRRFVTAPIPSPGESLILRPGL